MYQNIIQNERLLRGCGKILVVPDTFCFYEIFFPENIRINKILLKIDIFREENFVKTKCVKNSKNFVKIIKSKAFKLKTIAEKFLKNLYFALKWNLIPSV